jgi:formylglycine-generating enzyme required for sulfatase activity
MYSSHPPTTAMFTEFLRTEMQTTNHHDWHWPFFNEVLCGTMNDRERLGLPEHYKQGRLDVKIQESTQRLYGQSCERLLEIASSSSYELADRIAAGNYLALLGDPRINTFSPAMVAIQGGSVQLGLSRNDIEAVMHDFQGLGLNRSWIEKECPQYQAEITPYKIAMFPVTNQEFKEFLLDTKHSELPTSWEFRRYPQERANHPVYTVTHASADAYVKWLSEKTGRSFRLPTEAEWEWAAMGPDGREFPWGNEFNADYANTCETGLFNSTPVGVFVEGQSPFGLLDMAGNVEEYVADDYAPYVDAAFVKDHLVDIHGEYRVARGGGFARYRDLLRTRRRHGHNPKSPTYVMGFRIAESVEGTI